MHDDSEQVNPRETVYEFEDHGVHLTVAFSTPTFPKEVELLSRPVTYLSLAARSVDNASHSVQLYYDNTAEMTSVSADNTITWDHYHTQVGHDVHEPANIFPCIDFRVSENCLCASNM
jgi:hypothetical protein